MGGGGAKYIKVLDALLPSFPSTQGDSVSYSGHVHCSSSFSVSFFINAELNLKSLFY